MQLPFRKPSQPSCREYYGCKCIDDPKTIRKHVFIELTSKCNFSCDYCVYRHSKRKKDFISLPFLEKILLDLKKLKPIDYVMFSAFGEPMLHPQFSEACRLVKKYGYHLIVTTNGSLLNEETKNLPIDELYIRLETVTKRSFRLRNAGNLKLGDYLNKVCDFAKEVPFKTTLYFLKENRKAFPNYKDFISTKDKKKSIKLLENIGKKINPDFKVFLDNFDFFPNSIHISPNVKFYFKNLVARPHCWIPEHLNLIESESVPDCGYYKHHINILSNGEVTVCCTDYDGSMSLGNARLESLKKIYGRNKRDINLAVFPICRKCRGTLIPKQKS